MALYYDSFHPYLGQDISRIIPAGLLQQYSKTYTPATTSTEKLLNVERLLISEVSKREIMLGRSHEQTVSAIYVLGLVQSELCLHESACKTYHKLITLDDIRVRYGIGSRQHIGAMYRLGVHLNKCGQFEQAESILRESTPHLVGKYGLGSEFRKTITQILIALDGQNMHEAALELYQIFIDSVTYRSTGVDPAISDGSSSADTVTTSVSCDSCSTDFSAESPTGLRVPESSGTKTD